MDARPFLAIRERWWARRYLLSVVLVVAFHAIGAFGMLTPWRQSFIALSFANLVFTSILLLVNAEPLHLRTLVAFALCAMLGFALEVVGVETGLVFGTYHYTENLGPRWLGVPLVIGLNWAMLAYAAHVLACHLSAHRLARVIFGATLMTGVDYVLEPAAMHLDYWQWQGDNVPLRNYVAWWLASAVMIFVTDALVARPRNRLAPWVIGCFVVFLWLVRYG